MICNKWKAIQIRLLLFVNSPPLLPVPSIAFEFRVKFSNVLRTSLSKLPPKVMPVADSHCRLKMDQVEVSWLSCEESLIYCRIHEGNYTWKYCIFSLLHGIPLIFKFLFAIAFNLTHLQGFGTRSHYYSKCKWVDFWGLEAPNRPSNRCVTS